jgi:Tol biopolymer transport system component
MRFCLIHHTGQYFKILSEKHFGSGHPSVNRDSSYLLSDYYVGEYKKLGYHESPIRLIDINTDEEVYICKVFTDLDIQDNTFRIDPHPVWSRNYKKVCFNGAPEGIRQIFVADLSDVI